ncbi:MAG: hypothetical protein BJ554DRAFT_3059 [Olpidium bornovanus]|uniref:Uncharacterized protein n=1 Tax=Olpidium bornovanus TaxID=278681 RepID=A0A8H7ZQ49_9FUNG|nr:MAG: hypothetical protein BJ554DRAFT_3059 [Olpidium bornovanus]
MTSTGLRSAAVHDIEEVAGPAALPPGARGGGAELPGDEREEEEEGEEEEEEGEEEEEAGAGPCPRRGGRKRPRDADGAVCGGVREEDGRTAASAVSRRAGCGTSRCEPAEAKKEEEEEEEEARLAEFLALSDDDDGDDVPDAAAAESDRRLSVLQGGACVPADVWVHLLPADSGARAADPGPPPVPGAPASAAPAPADDRPAGHRPLRGAGSAVGPGRALRAGPPGAGVVGPLARACPGAAPGRPREAEARAAVFRPRHREPLPARAGHPRPRRPGAVRGRRGGGQPRGQMRDGLPASPRGGGGGGVSGDVERRQTEGGGPGAQAGRRLLPHRRVQVRLDARHPARGHARLARFPDSEETRAGMGQGARPRHH